jgi:hypothetical protein
MSSALEPLAASPPDDLENLKALLADLGESSTLQIEAGGDLHFALEARGPVPRRHHLAVAHTGLRGSGRVHIGRRVGDRARDVPAHHRRVLRRHGVALRPAAVVGTGDVGFGRPRTRGTASLLARSDPRRRAHRQDDVERLRPCRDARPHLRPAARTTARAVGGPARHEQLTQVPRAPLRVAAGATQLGSGEA